MGEMTLRDVALLCSIAGTMTDDPDEQPSHLDEWDIKAARAVLMRVAEWLDEKQSNLVEASITVAANQVDRSLRMRAIAARDIANELRAIAKEPTDADHR